MQGDTFKPVGQELSVRGAQNPVMPQNAGFTAVPVQPGAGQSVRDFTGRSGAGRADKSAPPQGAQQIPLAGAQPVGASPAAPPVQLSGATPPAASAAPQTQDGIAIPRRPEEAPRPTMGRPRPFMQRAVPRSADSYMVTLVGTAPDGQTYEVQIPYRADFPVGTQLGSPEIRMIEEDQG